MVRAPNITESIGKDMVRAPKITESIGKEFYLRIIDPGCDVKIQDAYEAKINAFLRCLFPQSGDASSSCSTHQTNQQHIKYSHHSMVEKDIARVSFRLSSNAITFYLNEAVVTFCEALFAKPEALRQLTVRGLLGLEPEGEIMRKMWYMVMFRAALMNGGVPLLAYMEVVYQHTFLVDWALTLCFCIVAKVDVRAVSELQTGEFSEESFRLAERILGKFFKKNDAAKSPRLKNVDVNTAMDDLLAVLLPIAANPSNGTLIIDIIIPLFTVAHAVACILLTAQEIFGEFIRRRTNVPKTPTVAKYSHAVKEVPHHPIHDLLRRNLDCDLCRSKLASEAIHPASLSGGGALPLIAACLVGGFTAGAVAFGGYKLVQWGWKQIEQTRAIQRERELKRAFEELLTKVNRLVGILDSAFALALEIQVMLEWIDLENKAFVSDETRQMCWEHLGPRTNPDDVVDHLRRQGKKLEDSRQNLGAGFIRVSLQEFMTWSPVPDA
ncbi:hypothetical protein BZA77DRAFT_300689 [Pyronema omphalodes]|nr:hypothetical protein BZA77DRAFT_300689 [Pyronema omphalodes]